MGEGYVSKYCNGCHVDHHASVLGMYLNACILYATLFGRSPVGAATPAGQVADGLELPGDDAIRGDGVVGALTKTEARALQQIAADVVLEDRDQYWRIRSDSPA